MHKSRLGDWAFILGQENLQQLYRKSSNMKAARLDSRTGGSSYYSNRVEKQSGSNSRDWTSAMEEELTTVFVSGNSIIKASILNLSGRRKDNHSIGLVKKHNSNHEASSSGMKEELVTALFCRQKDID